MPDYTYLQVAQPTTAGHWLLSFAYPALRDAERLRARLRRGSTAAPPAPAASTARASRSIARGSPTLLGFSEPIDPHARRDVADRRAGRCSPAHAAIAATGASRFAEDLELYGSDEFGLLRIGDELCRASALMPQKRNPYALVVIRGAAAHAARPGDRRAGDPAHAVGPHRQPALRLRRGLRRGRARRRGRCELAAATAESVTVDARGAPRARCARASRRRPTSPRS